jgi:LmeA-like phospholipid-binding
VTDYSGYQGYDQRRRRHPLRWIIIGVVVLLVILVGVDFAAKSYAEGQMASQIQQQGFPKKPNVTIEGFPFLTQVIAHDLKNVKLNATDVKEGPITISSINATMTGVHLNSSFQSGTIDHLTGVATITFAALSNAMSAQAGGLGDLASAGLKLSGAPPNEVKATIDLVIASGSATWRVTTPGNNKLNIHLVSSSGLPGDLLGAVSDMSITLPALPLGLKIQSLKVTSTGIVGTISGRNIPFTQNNS